MKIALVILHADAARGGAERYTLDLAVNLVKRGHAASLLASSFADVPPAVTSVPMAANGVGRLARYLRFLNSVDEETAGGKYDIVHAMLPIRRCDLYHPHAGIAADAIERGRLKRPTGISGTLSQFGNRFNLRRQRFAAVEHQLLTSSRPPVVLCLSDQIKNTVRRCYAALPDDRLITLFNSTDLARFDPALQPDRRQPMRQRFGFSTDDVIGLMLAQDFERKGLRQCIAAIAKIADPRLKLLVAGRQDPKEYRNLAARIGVTDRIRFAGPTAEPVAFYRTADFFVLPTRSDPCSLVVLEALAMGLPVISTAANGACEMMTDGKEGRILENPDDIPLLVRVMAAMLNAEERKTMSAASLSLRPRLALDRHLELLERVYVDLAGMEKGLAKQ